MLQGRPIARRNFCAFGDVVSFDATYSTNKYNMIFAPFIAKDNHGKCLTLAVALMTGESIESRSVHSSCNAASRCSQSAADVVDDQLRQTMAAAMLTCSTSPDRRPLLLP
ncbi:hypothetical protein C2S51_007105 [Perilla frutescens var. frutescens]|nr:hypothetical protein C2S51_007105 [Perilla frutescens var. frutescens]